ncbi:YfdX family protein [Ruegeria atlantica]|uniref:YfdX family protein n=1 Tax=Ruegeria atlantica TaxID=81569 RepID=UPI00147CE83F|nr:YfdX family protein [Ruegeria atlantica]
MKPNPNFAAAIVTAAALTTGFAEPASAAAETKTGGEHTEQASGQSIRVPANGKHILDGVHAARLALFDGNTDLARDMISNAHNEINDHAAEFAIKLPDTVGFAIPVESGLLFRDGFQPTDQHAPTISQAGALIRNGQVDEAITVMADAGIELDIKVVMLPVEPTATHLQQALTDIKAGHIHKANMTLKAVETSIEIQDFQPGALPSQGYPLSEILPG